MSEFRIERDSMGEVRLPAQAYYGAQTQRAVENFPISGRPLAAELIHALGLVKWAAAVANRDLGKLTGTGKNPLNAKQVEALLAACREVADGKFDDQFPVDVFQTGSGTSSNMNANEVIANRAIELLGGDRFSRRQADPSQRPRQHGPKHQRHVPHGHPRGRRPWRSRSELIPALERLRDVLADKGRPVGRDPQDRPHAPGRRHAASPGPGDRRLGPAVGAVDRAGRRGAWRRCCELPVGGTAVGTGINTHPEFGRRVAEVLARETGIPFVEAANHFEANAQRDGLVECHGQLRTIAVTLFNVANNIRWLGSGPRCGFYEIKLPDRQPGSSIMPGKVNPGAVREPDAGRRPGDGQRSDHRVLRRRRRAISS